MDFQVPPDPTRPLRLSTLVDQQLWFLGCDIRRAEGNALVAFGFTRYRSPDGSRPTCYVLPVAEQCVVACWGFAVYCGPVCSPQHDDNPPSLVAPLLPCGALLLRHALSSRVALAPLSVPIHARQQLPPHRVAHTRTERDVMRGHLQVLSDTFVQYERWARETLGEDYRRSTLHDLPRHKRRRFLRAPDLSGAWQASPWSATDATWSLPVRSQAR